MLMQAGESSTLADLLGVHREKIRHAPADNLLLSLTLTSTLNLTLNLTLTLTLTLALTLTLTLTLTRHIAKEPANETVTDAPTLPERFVAAKQAREAALAELASLKHRKPFHTTQVRAGHRLKGAISPISPYISPTSPLSLPYLSPSLPYLCPSLPYLSPGARVAPAQGRDGAAAQPADGRARRQG